MDTPPTNDNVVQFPSPANIEQTDGDWDNPILMLAEVISAISAGDFKPTGVVVAILDEQSDNHAVFRYEMSGTDIALFFSAYLEALRKSGSN